MTELDAARHMKDMNEKLDIVQEYVLACIRVSQAYRSGVQRIEVRVAPGTVSDP